MVKLNWCSFHSVTYIVLNHTIPHHTICYLIVMDTTEGNSVYLFHFFLLFYFFFFLFAMPHIIGHHDEKTTCVCLPFDRLTNAQQERGSFSRDANHPAANIPNKRLFHWFRAHQLQFPRQFFRFLLLLYFYHFTPAQVFGSHHFWNNIFDCLCVPIRSVYQLACLTVEGPISRPIV